MAGQGGSQDSKARPGQRRIAQWTRDYARLPGIPDEFIGPDGAPRAAWTPLLRCLRRACRRPRSSAASPAADRHLREAGVTYRAPGETAERLWPLSHLPLLIDEADWQQI